MFCTASANGNHSLEATTARSLPLPACPSCSSLKRLFAGHPALGTKLPYWYRNPFHAFSCIYRDEGTMIACRFFPSLCAHRSCRYPGFFGLYQGYRSSLLLDCSFAALQFAMYEQLKVFGGSVVGRPLHDQENLMTGAVAGALAGMLTNPLDVIVARLQTQGQPRRYAGVVDCCTRILREVRVLFYSSALARCVSSSVV